MQLESTKVPPNFSTNPFHEISITIGTSTTSISDLLLRHCVVKSARSNEESTEDVDGIAVCIFACLVMNE
jgi:hypothetical protein